MKFKQLQKEGTRGKKYKAQGGAILEWSGVLESYIIC